jgi:4-oxalocrotonate tautomerase
MPHVIVKLWPGKSDAQKVKLADEIARAMIAVMGSREEAISVGFEEVDSKDWAEKVVEPDILGKPETIYRKPGTRA